VTRVTLALGGGLLDGVFDTEAERVTYRCGVLVAVRTFCHGRECFGGAPLGAYPAPPIRPPKPKPVADAATTRRYRREGAFTVAEALADPSLLDGPAAACGACGGPLEPGERLVTATGQRLCDGCWYGELGAVVERHPVVPGGLRG